MQPTGLTKPSGEEMNLDLGDTQLLIKTCKKYKLSLQEAAYVLATAYWETARTMKPVREAYWVSEGWRQRNLRYYPHYGRGYVQLTWDYNYIKAGKKLGVDFLPDLDKAMEPRYAAPIIVIGMKEGWFTGKKLSDYIKEGSVNYRSARRIVNGVDKASEIAALAASYEDAIKDTYNKTNPIAAFFAALVGALANATKQA